MNHVQNQVQDQIADIQLPAESWTPQRTLSWAFEKFGNNVAISSAFGAEGMVLIDMASRVHKDFPPLHHRHRISLSRNLQPDGPD